MDRKECMIVDLDKSGSKDIIDAIRQLLYSHGLTEITFPKEQDDPVWVIWFDNNADPFEIGRAHV